MWQGPARPCGGRGAHGPRSNTNRRRGRSRNTRRRRSAKNPSAKNPSTKSPSAIANRIRQSSRTRPARKRRARAPRARLSLWLWPRARLRQQAWRAVRRAPRAVHLLMVLAVLGAAALAVNGIFQVLRKPTELFFPVSGALNKLPDET